MDLKQEVASAESDPAPEALAIEIADVGQIYEIDSCQNIEEVEDHQPKMRYKRERITFTRQQLEILEELFKKSAYPDVSEIVDMKEKTQLSESKLVVWFKNKRAKARRQIRDLDVPTPFKDSFSDCTLSFVDVNKDNSASFRNRTYKKFKKPSTKLKSEYTSEYVPLSLSGSSSSVPRPSSHVPESSSVSRPSSQIPGSSSSVPGSFSSVPRPSCHVPESSSVPRPSSQIPGSSSCSNQIRSQQPIQFTYHQLPLDQDITEGAAVTVSAQFKPILLKILMQAPD